jgi:hypothetical protein
LLLPEMSFGSIIDDTITAVGNAANGIVQTGETAVDNLTGAVGSVGSGLGSGLASIGQGVGTGVADVGQGVGTGVADIGSGIQNVGQGLSNFMPFLIGGAVVLGGLYLYGQQNNSHAPGYSTAMCHACGGSKYKM